MVGEANSRTLPSHDHGYQAGGSWGNRHEAVVRAHADFEASKRRRSIVADARRCTTAAFKHGRHPRQRHTATFLNSNASTASRKPPGATIEQERGSLAIADAGISNAILNPEILRIPDLKVRAKALPRRVHELRLGTVS